MSNVLVPDREVVTEEKEILVGTESEIVTILPFNTYIYFYYVDDEWVGINYGEHAYYVNAAYVSDDSCSYEVFDIPRNSGFKSYTPYTAITNKKSKQYKLQKLASTNRYGLRVVNSCYCIAIGTAFNTPVGTYVDLILENNTMIPCIVADVKSDKYTNSDNIVTSRNNCVSEFVIDKNKLSNTVIQSGDISDVCNEWNSSIKEIVVYDKNVFEKEN